MSMIKILHYRIKMSKREPFADWLDDQDIKTQAVINARLDRVRLGNFGDCTRIKDGDGIWELRIDYGPGYRIYYGKDGLKVVILLIAGDKSTQRRDISKAGKYWQDYKESSNG